MRTWIYAAAMAAVAATGCNDPAADGGDGDVTNLDADAAGSGETGADDTTPGEDGGSNDGGGPDGGGGDDVRAGDDVAPGEDARPGDDVRPGEDAGPGEDVPPGEDAGPGDDAGEDTVEPARCGDAVVDPGEACDDGNFDDNDGCTTTCTPSFEDLCRRCDAGDRCEGGACLALADGEFCGADCTDDDCPAGFGCEEVFVEGARTRQCVPRSGVCEPCVDRDGDGYGIGDDCDGVDCDDRDDDVNPGADEVCDEVDNNCDGVIDNIVEGTRWYFDRDGDGVGRDEGSTVACERPGRDFVNRGGDCDDSNGELAPGLPELCDGADNDCDGEVDEDPTTADPRFPDRDGDGWGDTSDPVFECAPDGDLVARGGDCDDDAADVSPDADEVCDDGADNDCNGAADCADDACAEVEDCATPDCADDNLGGALGTGVAAGALPRRDSEFAPSCGATTGTEVRYAWTAPYDGTFTFDTVGSSFDTVLEINAGCDGASLGCNDNHAPFNFTPNRNRSLLEVELEAGDRVVVTVDSLGGGGGGGTNYRLNIAGDRVEVCDDGVDNDFNGATDCGDAGCSLDEACCPDDVFEPNQGNSASPSTTWDAYQANRDAALTVRSSDLDSYRLPSCNGAVYTIEATFQHARGDLDLRLLRPNGTQLANAVSETDNETLSFTLGETLDRVFLQAYVAGGGEACVPYTLSIDVDTSACP